MATPVAYIRRSSADADSPGDISREAQEAAVRELAIREGYNGEVRYFVDWARSADEEKEARRTEFRAMLSAVEGGEVSTIYAYALDRLARSTATFARLLKAAKDHGVRVVTHREGDLSDTGNPQAWAYGHLVSFFAEWELKMTKARAASSLEHRRARGDQLGQAPLGFRHVKDATGRIVRVPDESDPLRPILQAVTDAGSVLGACRLLEQRGIAAPKGGAAWSTSTLTRILAANAPELLPRRGPAGRRVPSAAMLAQLLRCHCGHVLTPNRPRGQYYCNTGHRQGSKAHGKYNVRESDLLPWVKAEAGRLRTPEGVTLGERNDQRRAELEAQRERLGWAVTDGLLDRERAQARAATIDAELAQLDDQEAIVAVPAIDWQHWDIASVNEVLRSLWDHVQLNEQMHPLRAAWRVPEWRE